MTDDFQATADVIIIFIGLFFLIYMYMNSKIYEKYIENKVKKNIKQGQRDYYIKRGLPIPKDLK